VTCFWLTLTYSFVRIACQPPRMAGPLARIERRREQNDVVADTGGGNTRNRQPRIRFSSQVGSRPYEFTNGLKTVGSLWQEWMHGINGRMPVKEFLPKHTGSNANKDRWYQRRPIYELLGNLVRAGIAPCEAIALVEEAYPNIKMTALGRKIRADTKNNTLPRCLRI
jgi:Transcriptional activator of glycolytic enzymes